MNRRHVIIHQVAEAEIDQIARYLAEDSLPAALRFYDSVDETCKFLLRMPLAGKARISKDPSLIGLRSWSMKGFRNYLLFYIPRKDIIEVLHVVHGARDLPRHLGVE